MSSEQRRLAGRYVLETPIGRGGMGQVWRGTDSVLGREVAVKTIDLRNLPDESGAARFEREARATAGLSHPGVVTVHDSGVEGDTAYIVMELLPGPTLADRIADGPVPVDEVVEVGRQVASALDAAHARGLVHRDIKPANVSYAADGRVRVLDFGIAQLAESPGSQVLTATHTVMGTAEYLAPEQAMGGRVDGRADLYALGCVLYALLAGRPPFRGATPVATMMMHANDPVPDVRELRPDTPDWLADLVHRLLAKDPADRPAGAATVAEALASREALAGAATTVLPAAGAATTQRLDPGCRRWWHRCRPPVPSPCPSGATAGSHRCSPSSPSSRSGCWRGSCSTTVTTPARRRRRARRPPSPRRRPRPRRRRRPRPPRPPRRPTPTTEAPSPTPDPADAVDAALADFSDEVDTVAGEQLITADAADTLNKRVRDINKALRQDEQDKVAEETDKLREDFDKAVADGEITPDGASRLDPLLQKVEDAVAAYAG